VQKHVGSGNLFEISLTAHLAHFTPACTMVTVFFCKSITC